MRRQNHACDQCRRSKRGCDLFIPKDITTAWLPCSYCKRTNKTCTIIWAQSQKKIQRTAANRQRSHTASSSSAGNDSVAVWQQSVPDQLPNGDGAFPFLGFGGDPGTPNIIHHDSCGAASLGLGMSLPNGPYGALETPCVDLSAPGDFPLQGYVDLSEEAISHEEQEPFPKDESPYFSPQSLPGVFPGQEKFCSPLSANQTIATSVNSLLISSNLVQLYHDVFEHNLSCWLTESTCPYLLHGSQTNLQVRANTQSYTEQTNAQSTYNRIYRRTVELDKAALAAGVISLTPLQDQAASEALNLAVLAFSAQWAQGSQRARADFASSLRQSNDYRSKTPEFDETLQRQLWETAKAALERTAYLESYRVAYAEVIFALTQRSWDDGSKVNVHELPTSGAVKSRINEIIAQEGPPIYMERAARKIHILESRIDTALGKAKSHYAKANTKSIIELNMRHHGTLRLLHWLVVMVDTVSSSMYERPLVISDEEIQFCPSDQPNECATSEVRRLRENALGIQNFIRDNLSDPAYLPQWPCSFAEASYAVAQAAQVKVLLFRQVSCLQRYIRQGRPRGDIDSLVQTAIKIRSFWQSTYGCFFMQLSENIDSVPQRIQNWYLCIGAHWNLAVLILADLLETIASSELTPERDMQASRLKLSSQFRKTASEELAYLAYVATPDHDPRANPQLSEFHHALDESRVLAEPYAMMLIRGFTKAAMNLLNVLENSVLEVEVDLNRRRLRECTKVLWYLGKKSSMARQIAEVLHGICRSFQEPDGNQTGWSDSWFGHDISVF